TTHIAVPIVSGDTLVGIAALPDGSALYVSTRFAFVFRVDLGTNVASPAVAGVGGLDAPIVAAPDSSAVYVAGGNTVWRVTVPWNQVSSVKADPNPGVDIREIALSPDGRTLYAAQIDNANSPPRDRLHRIDTTTMQVSSVALSAHPLSV